MPQHMLDADTVSFVCKVSISPTLGAAGVGALSPAETRQC